VKYSVPKIIIFKTDSRNPIIIDCGANIGVATIYFKRLYPDSRILSFEANPIRMHYFKGILIKTNSPMLKCIILLIRYRY
jgi:hypothetical protein